MMFQRIEGGEKMQTTQKLFTVHHNPTFHSLGGAKNYYSWQDWTILIIGFLHQASNAHETFSVHYNNAN
jgi:hypothetical protein